MKRLIQRVALSAQIISTRFAPADLMNARISQRTRCVALAMTASVTMLIGGNSAQAFGGHFGGERIVSSEVVSDEVVGESYEGGESVSGGGGDCANGDCGGGGAGGVVNRQYGQPDLFYNFYTQGGANSANAQMYVSPVPVPKNVGHTHLTYQPFYPHHMLYGHKDRFHNYYDNGRGMNRTSVNYGTRPVHSAISNVYWNILRIPR